MKKIPDLSLGTVLFERYTLIEVLSLGVFVAIDNGTGGKVIVKHAEHEQLEREWLCMTQCHSPYINQPIEILSSLLILPYVEGESLITFSLDQCSLFIACLPKIVRAIDCVHQAGWVHCDVKPSNILYLPELGSIKLIDFGAAWPVGTSLYQLNEWQLTPGFSRSTRQEGIGNIEREDDWYALAKWLEQIDESVLGLKDQRQLGRWKLWLRARTSHCNVL
ncbi:hypothetical protein MD588_03595 [Photobacterium sp. SDRW27]|uniref:protein kinase domain-containing protein n=1 Tax=Photobacterium obscurum TaxID=2829490 RepID=UPI0022435F04|nr:hypothetical protein [Photobacterium obscurum]MCW8327882.1 hypothetical protein [Photobacterium obscurum]